MVEFPFENDSALEKMYFTRSLGFLSLSFLKSSFNVNSFFYKCVYVFFLIFCLPEQFNWDNYLKETESVAAPLHCFRQVCQILFCKCMSIVYACYRVILGKLSHLDCLQTSHLTSFDL